MQPQQYVMARMVPMLNYYQDRLPRKYRQWKVTVFLLLFCTCAIAVLSFLNYIAVSGVVAGVATAITAWQAESGADRKINRYNTAILSITNHIMWWDSLNSVDKNSQTNISRLVTVGEEIRLNEISAWADASRQKEDGEEEGGAEKDSETQTIGTV